MQSTYVSVGYSDSHSVKSPLSKPMLGCDNEHVTVGVWEGVAEGY